MPNPLMAELDYDETMQPHERGSILVFAVYEAFLAIVASRTEDLIRSPPAAPASCRPGALHPGLVDRLAEETCKAAEHVLAMCIRALDYCPAVDITFGEYLRALITADIDAFPADPRHYRLAFMESFRKWKLLPRDVRTVVRRDARLEHARRSVARLAARSAGGHRSQLEPRPRPFRDIRAEREEPLGAVERHEREAFAADRDLYGQFGLMPDLPRYNPRRQAVQEGREGRVDVRGVRRAADPPGRARTARSAPRSSPPSISAWRCGSTAHRDATANSAEDFMWFRGGASVIIDPRKGREEIRY